MKTIKELIEHLQKEPLDADVFIGASAEKLGYALIVIANEGKLNHAHEIQV